MSAEVPALKQKAAPESPTPIDTTQEVPGPSPVAEEQQCFDGDQCEAETIDEPEFKAPRIRGTGGGLDYTIVAKNGFVVMGLKLMRTSGYAGDASRLGICVRLRTTFEEGLAFSEREDLNGRLDEAFGDLPYEIHGDTRYGYRARTHLNFLTAKRSGQEGLVVDALRAGRFYAKLYAFVEQFVVEPAEFTLSYDDFVDALEEQVLDLFPVPEPEPIDEEPEDVSDASGIGIVRNAAAANAATVDDDGDDFDLDEDF